MTPPLIIGLITLIALPAIANPGGEARQRAFKNILRSFEPMGLMVRGRAPYNKDEFIRYANTLKKTAREPFPLFTPNTIDAKSRAKPEIWSQPAKFQTETDKFLTAVDELNTVAYAGNLAAIKNSYGVIAQSCKSCHDAFRGPER